MSYTVYILYITYSTYIIIFMHVYIGTDGMYCTVNGKFSVYVNI